MSPSVEASRVTVQFELCPHGQWSAHNAEINEDGDLIPTPACEGGRMFIGNRTYNIPGLIGSTLKRQVRVGDLLWKPEAVVDVDDVLARRVLNRSRLEAAGVGPSDPSARLDEREFEGDDVAAERATMNLDYEAATEMFVSIVDPAYPVEDLDRDIVRMIVDAAVPKPCEHGNTGRHIAWEKHVTPGDRVTFSYDWCDGKPEDDNE